MLRHLSLSLLLGLGTLAAQAGPTTSPLKIGLVLPMSGPFASYGRQVERGVRLYLQQHGDTLGGRRIEILLRDDPGLNSDATLRVTQGLADKDKADLLAGFGITPQAMSAAPVSAETQKPMVVMNAAGSAVTTRSPYIVRTSFTSAQATAPMAQWAAGGGLKTAYTLVADYGPGLDAETQFKKRFSEAGGQVVGEARVPLKGADFAPIMQKIREAKPATIFLYLPPGDQTVGFLKGYRNSELDKAGVRLVSTGDLTDDELLSKLGDDALKLLTTYHYSVLHDSPENKAFVAAYTSQWPGEWPNHMTLGGYDGMRLIDEVLKKTGGDAEGEKFIAAARGLSWTSPRGPVRIDPRTRDIIQTIYIRKVVKLNGRLGNQEFGRIEGVRDPGKD